MTGFPNHRKQKRNFGATGTLPATLTACVILLSGCGEKRARAIPWATAIRVHPVLPPVLANDGNTSLDGAPNLGVVPPAPTPDLLARRPAPPRPHVAGGNSEGEEQVQGQKRGPGPVLAPQLSPQDLALAQQQTNESLGVADRSLQAAKGRQLNTAQADLVSKISSFAAEARKAAGEGDWTRARNLAKKAQVLAEELATHL